MEQNIENKGDIIIYQTEDGLTKIDVKIEKETVWLNQQQMAILFQSSRTNVVEHIKHIYEEGELSVESTCDSSLNTRFCYLFSFIRDSQSIT